MKLVKTKLFQGIIHCETGLHIGGSSDEIEIGAVDMTVIKHPVSGEPYIPGSSLKGKMRSSLEREKGVDSRGEPCGCGGNACMVCRIFGPHKNTRHQLGPTRIIVRDANLNTKSRDEMQKHLRERGIMFFEKKTENIIDRFKGMALHPRSMERVPMDTDFDLEIVLQVYDSDNEIQMVKTVKDGLTWVEKTYLGKGGSRGSGKVTFNNLTLDGQPFSLA
ncbi:MAG: CRISPR type III-associated RAMP protein Csm3 [Dehalococcoidia bacterium]|nr:CRISPR type III-associated RAMP protein Csm3 [Bacillota bacterium]MBT9142424.1 CRISPR type III-associated RAMP protein Csm3 [Bacillota bacterium]